MRCILGVDAGGTKCDALLVRDDGTALSWGHCSVINPCSGRSASGSGRSSRSVSYAVREAIGDIRFEELHITGLSGILPFGFVRDEPSARIILHSITEQTAALTLAGETAGVVALAGTGALVYGRTRDGRSLRLDGLGPMLGDYGGGYQIGARAVRAAAKSNWHPRHQTSLAGAVGRRLGVNPHDPLGAHFLIEYMHGDRDRAEIAILATLVSAEAEAGDRIAREILEGAADDLADTLRDLVDRLQMEPDPYALVGTGGIITNSRIYWDRFCKRALEYAPNLRPAISDLPAVVG